MSARGTRTLSRLFQATMKMLPEKKHSGTMEDAISATSEKDLVFGLDSPSLSKEQEMIWYYNSKLVFKDGKFLDMELVNEKRQLLCAGKLFRQPDHPFERGQIELFVLLLDNYLVMTKPVGKGLGTMFHVYKRPIPLDLLKLEAYGDTPARTKRKSAMFLGRGEVTISYLSESAAAGTAGDHRGTFPITITHEGHSGGSYTLYADTKETRSMWRSKLEEAIQLRQQSSRVFKVKVLNQESFLIRTGVSSGYLPEGRQLTRTINCATPFSTRDGRSLIAIGCVEGLWIGDARGPQSFHRILPLQMIRQCAVLEESGIILILTHNDLCAYDLESCVPTSMDPQTCYPPQKLNRRGDVPFFRVGMFNGKTHVIFPRRKHADTIFQMFEVVRSMEQTPEVIQPDAKPEWFRLHRESRLSSDCVDVVFLRRGLVILYRNGFCTFDPLNMDSVDMPRPAERNAEHKNLIKRCASSHSLGMLRLQGETFLLCYDKLGVYIDKHGTLINNRVAVEWEGVAERVSYHYPYVLLFSSSFVEVRHAASGRLEQIIRGNGTQCIWEGRDCRGEDPTTVQPGQNLGVVGVTHAPAGLDELTVQCIFTLVPSNRSLSPIRTQPSISTLERPNTRL